MVSVLSETPANVTTPPTAEAVRLPPGGALRAVVLGPLLTARVTLPASSLRSFAMRAARPCRIATLQEQMVGTARRSNTRPPYDCFNP